MKVACCGTALVLQGAMGAHAAANPPVKFQVRAGRAGDSEQAVARAERGAIEPRLGRRIDRVWRALPFERTTVTWAEPGEARLRRRRGRVVDRSAWLRSAEYAAAHALNDVGRRGQRAVYDGQQG